MIIRVCCALAITLYYWNIYSHRTEDQMTPPPSTRKAQPPNYKLPGLRDPLGASALGSQAVSPSIQSTKKRMAERSVSAELPAGLIYPCFKYVPADLSRAEEALEYNIAKMRSRLSILYQMKEEQMEAEGGKTITSARRNKRYSRLLLRSGIRRKSTQKTSYILFGTPLRRPVLQRVIRSEM
jgi:hypothetical protein